MKKKLITGILITTITITGILISSLFVSKINTVNFNIFSLDNSLTNKSDNLLDKINATDAIVNLVFKKIDRDKSKLNNSTFNQKFFNWNISNVINIEKEMFNKTSLFNQSLNNWNISSVTNMSYMFNKTYSFNQDLNNWNVDMN